MFEMNDNEETFVTNSTLEIIPRKGEQIWFVPAGERKTCTVVDVCHLIAIDNGNSYHTAHVYLETIK